MIVFVIAAVGTDGQRYFPREPRNDHRHAKKRRTESVEMHCSSVESWNANRLDLVELAVSDSNEVRVFFLSLFLVDKFYVDLTLVWC